MQGQDLPWAQREPITICQGAFKRIYGMSNDKLQEGIIWFDACTVDLYRTNSFLPDRSNILLVVISVLAAMKQVRNEAMRPVNIAAGMPKLSLRRSRVKAWLAAYFKTNCDKMPHCNGRSQVWHLPSTLTKLDVFNTYKQFMEGQGYTDNDIVALPTFRAIWRADFKHVSIPVKNRFKQCTT